MAAGSRRSHSGGRGSSVSSRRMSWYRGGLVSSGPHRRLSPSGIRETCQVANSSAQSEADPRPQRRSPAAKRTSAQQRIIAPRPSRRLLPWPAMFTATSSSRRGFGQPSGFSDVRMSAAIDTVWLTKPCEALKRRASPESRHATAPARRRRHPRPLTLSTDPREGLRDFFRAAPAPRRPLKLMR